MTAKGGHLRNLHAQIPSLLDFGTQTGTVQSGAVTRKPGSPGVTILGTLVCGEKKMEHGQGLTRGWEEGGPRLTSSGRS